MKYKVAEMTGREVGGVMRIDSFRFALQKLLRRDDDRPIRKMPFVSGDQIFGATVERALQKGAVIRISQFEVANANRYDHLG